MRHRYLELILPGKETSLTIELITEETTVTPASILEQCQQILKQRGAMRDSDEQALENSFGLASDWYNVLFPNSDLEVSARDIIEIMIALKLARFAKAGKNGVRDEDSILDLIVYLAFWLTEVRNNH